MQAKERPRGSMVATFALAAGVLFAGDLGAPWLKITPAPVQRPSTSPRCRSGARSAWLSVDRAQSGVPLDAHGRHGRGAHLRQQDGACSLTADEDGVRAPPRAGAERRPRQRRRARGARRRKIRPARHLRRRARSHRGPLDDAGPVQEEHRRPLRQPGGLPVVIEDARGYVRRSVEPFRNIEIVLPDVQAPWGAGILAPEAGRALHGRGFHRPLPRAPTPDGTVVATRLDAEVDRLLHALGHGPAAARRGRPLAAPLRVRHADDDDAPREQVAARPVRGVALLLWQLLPEEQAGRGVLAWRCSATDARRKLCASPEAAPPGRSTCARPRTTGPSSPAWCRPERSGARSPT